MVAHRGVRCDWNSEVKNAVTEVSEIRGLLLRNDLLHSPRNCPECNVKTGRPHKAECDVERCSACGRQRISCGCGGAHDSLFSRWTGFWPGELECIALGMVVKWDKDSNHPAPHDVGKPRMQGDLNRFAEEGWNRIFFVKPHPECDKPEVRTQ